MAKYIGRRVNIGVGKETSRGTAAAASRWVPKIDYTLWEKANKATSEESLSHISGYGPQEIVTQKHAEGMLNGEINLKSWPLFLLSTFGSVSSAAENSDYKHTITLSNSNQHQSLTFHTLEPNGNLQFPLAVVDSLDLTVNPEEIVKFELGLKSRLPGTSTESASYESTDYKFIGRHLELKVADDTASLSGSTAIRTKELSMTISKNTEFDLVNSSIEPEEIHNKQITIEGTITLNYEDNTWKNYMLNGTYKAIGIKLKDTSTTMNSENPEFYLELPICAFSEWERETGNDDIQTQTINFKALYDQNNSRLISDCYVVNDVASY
jgi:hypothetical protein